MKRVWVLQHTPKESPGLLGEMIEDKGFRLDVVHAYQGQEVPREMADASGLVVMGGPMGVYEEDQYPFLKAERHLIEVALRQGKPVIGICLGSQLLASVLGAVVAKGPQREIGWLPVQLYSVAGDDHLWSGVEETFTGFHWHGDQFTLPQECVAIARSEVSEFQAFRYKESAYGFLFHMEVTEAIIRGLMQDFPEEMADAKVEEEQIITGMRRHLSSLHGIGRDVFSKWAELLQ